MIEQTPELRATGIGGSDAGIIIGVSKYKTPLELYFEKTGEAKSFEGNEATHFGNVLEETVAREYERRTGQQVQCSNRTHRHPEFYWMMAHVDRRVLKCEGGKGLECKTALSKWWNPDDWGASGTDEVPLSYIAQCQHYMAVTGWEQWDLAVLLSGPEFRIYHIPRNQELIDTMIERERAFWRCVQEHTPPAPINTSDCQKLYPREAGSTWVASVDTIDRVTELRLIQAEIKNLKSEEEQIKTAVMKEMGSCAYLMDKDGNQLLSWKNQTRSTFDYKEFQAAHPEISYDEFYKTSSSRIMRLKGEK